MADPNRRSPRPRRPRIAAAGRITVPALLALVLAGPGPALAGPTLRCTGAENATTTVVLPDEGAARTVIAPAGAPARPADMWLGEIETSHAQGRAPVLFDQDSLVAEAALTGIVLEPMRGNPVLVVILTRHDQGIVLRLFDLAFLGPAIETAACR